MTAVASSSQSLVIRRAEARDVSLVLSFIRELADYERLAHEVDAGEGDLAAALFGPNPRVFADIAEWEGEPAGFALWFYNFSTFRGRHGIYLEDLFVRPAFRSKGIGRELLRHLARICIAENLPRLEWWVLDWNEPALRFYRSIGAVPMDEWTVQRVTGEALERLAG
ncbi:GNAT family N-acetyltransferase [Microvirga thermotolerans]|uniref:GNAT family N-acetyltransferase n=1 Tax=Microvirga thermotolerans TaxID=2651334 RepID=A0A5P9JYY4_9HYPH|nr:GNAT family N-acetyltransferase [Microvirga thermotolerans]QFU18052.1 GNAT family N-acetyltransferase [Microvirga thermotolerans]